MYLRRVSRMADRIFRVVFPPVVLKENRRKRIIHISPSIHPKIILALGFGSDWLRFRFAYINYLAVRV